jgi:hypothetical protein
VDRPARNFGRISLLIAALNLAVRPAAVLIARLAAEAAYRGDNSEAAFWSWACCMALGSLASLGLGVAWLLAVLLASARGWALAGLVCVGLILNATAIYWASSWLRP